MTITFQFNLERTVFFNYNAINQDRGVQQKVAVKGYTPLACPLSSILFYLFIIN